MNNFPSRRVRRAFLGSVFLDANQYVLVSSTVRSVLAYLVERGQVEMRFDGGRVLWARVG